MAGEADSFLLLIVAFIFPPAAVAFVAGCGVDLCLNILLTLLGYLPGMIHAFWLVLKRAEANEQYGYRNWIYTGMGEYLPYDNRPPMRGQAPGTYGQPREVPPPPPGQYSRDTPAGPQPAQTPGPLEQKQAYQAPPSQAPGYESQSQTQVPSQAADQKYGYTGMPQAPPAAGDQKASSEQKNNTTEGIPPSST